MESTAAMFTNLKQVRQRVESLPTRGLPGRPNRVKGFRHLDGPTTYIVTIGFQEVEGIDPFKSTKEDVVAWANQYFTI